MKLLIVCSSNRVSLEPAVCQKLRTDSLTSLPPYQSVLLSERAGRSSPLLLISMTKHWPEQSLLAVPTLSHLGEHHDHQLDFHRDAQRSLPLRGVARSTQAQHWLHHPAQMVPQQPSRHEKPAARHEHLTTGTSAPAPMDQDASCRNPQDAPHKQESIAGDSWSSGRENSGTGAGKKKNYQRYPKPPYSYLAMIAMVIQRSPEKKLTLSEVR